MEALMLVVILAVCAAVAAALPNERQVWRLRQWVDHLDQ
jgi:hypothetical protein